MRAFSRDPLRGCPPHRYHRPGSPAEAPADANQLFCGWFQGPGSKLSLVEITDPEARAAADLIERRSAHRSDWDRQINRSQLGEARRALALDEAGRRPPHTWRNLAPRERDLLHSQLDVLAALMERRPVPERAPFCVALDPSLIYDPAQRATAELGRKLGGGPLLTTEGLERLEAAQVAHAGNEPLPAEITESRDDPALVSALSPDRIRALRTFFELGDGALLEGPPVAIEGRLFGETYPLPCPNRDPKALVELLKDYETRFEESGFDRLYLLVDDGPLLLALNPRGPLDHLTPKMRAEVRDPKDSNETIGSAEVLLIEHRNNSLYEATVDFWLDAPRKVGALFNKAVGKSIEDRVQHAAGEVVGSADSKKSGSSASGAMMAAGGAAAFGSVFGSMALHLPVLIGVLGAVGALVTVANVSDAIHNQRRQARAPIYHAMRVTLAAPRPGSH